MTVQKYIETVIQPKLQGDGGWVEYVSEENGVLNLVFKGECSKCKILYRCTDWITEQIKTDLKKDVKIIADCKKPYFQS